MSRGFWMHESCMDAYILVLKIQFRGPNYIKAKVEWWVRGLFIGVKQTIKIMSAELKRWRPK